MMTGLFFVVLGALILVYPQILIAMIAGFVMLFGLGIMATAWQFRRMRRSSRSPFINWIVRW
jgi:uncharacterized membrane protein YqjE